MNEPREATVGRLTVHQNPTDDNIFEIRVGSLSLTIWMGDRWANTVNVHNCNDDHKLRKSKGLYAGCVWLERE